MLTLASPVNGEKMPLIPRYDRTVETITGFAGALAPASTGSMRAAAP